MTTAEHRKELIDRYKDGYRIVAEALAGAKDEELDTRPAPNKWSAREIVHHLADSEMIAAVRFRILLTVDTPQIQGFDQDQFVTRLFYDRPTEAALDAFKSARRTTAEIMERMSEADWQRAGVHTEQGRYTIERWLELYADHAHKHADQIRAARDAGRKAQATSQSSPER